MCDRCCFEARRRCNRKAKNATMAMTRVIGQREAEHSDDHVSAKGWRDRCAPRDRIMAELSGREGRIDGLRSEQQAEER